MLLKHRESSAEEKTIEIQQRINATPNIEDFGTKLGGARKDKARSMREAVSDDEIARA